MSDKATRAGERALAGARMARVKLDCAAPLFEVLRALDGTPENGPLWSQALALLEAARAAVALDGDA